MNVARVERTAIYKVTAHVRGGFTLIELSIVLVIIGLVIAGVLVGYHMLESATNRKLMREIEQYNTAILTFKVKYGQNPGDFSQATQIWGDAFGWPTGETVDGNGDGRIPICSAEQSRLFEHLSLAGLVSGKYDRDIAVPNDQLGVTYPRTVYPNSGWRVISDMGMGGNWIRYNDVLNLNMSREQANCLDGGGAEFTPRAYWALDVKYDDGKSTSGRIWNWGITCADWGTPGNYLTNNDTTKECSVFYMLSTSN